MLLSPRIVYENEDFALLDKPYGLTVNRSETTKGQKTLQDWVEKEFKIQNSKFKVDKEEDFYRRSGIVHRLDKDTSGLIIVAKNPSAFENLQRQFKERVVKKSYLALVWGKLKVKGEINAPITRNPYNRSKFGIFVGGKEAKTGYSVLRNVNISGYEMTLLEVTPVTGRTHQIRVHLSYLGHPLVGDPLYSGRKRERVGLRLFGRLMLHAYKISFLNPKDKKRLEFKAEIPEEFNLT